MAGIQRIPPSAPMTLHPPTQFPSSRLSTRRLPRLALAIGLLALAALMAPARGAATYTIEVIAPEEQLLAGGAQDFPVRLREFIPTGSTGFEGFFGEFPLKSITVHVKSVNSVPVSFTPRAGLGAQVTPLNPEVATGIQFILTADPPTTPPADNTPISGVSEWEIGTLRIDLGPPVLIDDGGAIPANILLLDLELFAGSGIYQPQPGDPGSGAGFLITTTEMEVYGSPETDPSDYTDESDVEVADGTTRVVDEELTQTGILRATNGGEVVVDAAMVNFGVVEGRNGRLDLNAAFSNVGTVRAAEGGSVEIGADFANFGTLEALAGSTITTLGAGIRQLEGSDTPVTYDDKIAAGVFRVVDGVMNVAPPGFILAEICRGALEISGPSAETNFFDEAASGPGDFSTSGRGITLSEGGRLLLGDGVSLDVFDVSFFDGCLELHDGASLTSFIGVSGSSGKVAGDGSIAATHVGLSVGEVEVGRGPDATGTLDVDGAASFQVQSDLRLDIASATEFDALAVTGRLFIQTGEVDGAVLHVTLADGYSPPLGQQFVVATAGEVDGTFDLVCDNSPLVDFLPVVGPGTLTLEVVADPLGQFRALHGLPQDGSADHVDSSGNGYTNLQHYLYGLGDPTVATIDPSRLPSLEVLPGGDQVAFRFVRPIRPGCFIFRALTSADLLSWVVPGSLGFDYLPQAESVDLLDTSHLRVTQIYARQEGEDQRFYLLSAEPVEDAAGSP